MKKRELSVIMMALVSILCLSACTPKNELVFLNTNELFDEFQMKKELEAKALTTQNARQAIMDSLKIQVQLQAREVEIDQGQDQDKLNQYQLSRQEYLLKQEQFDKDNQLQAKQYNDQIWKQLNQYVKDYGEEHTYDFIFGATGAGNLMYAKEGKDITKDVIEYVNEKYQGVKN